MKGKNKAFSIILKVKFNPQPLEGIIELEKGRNNDKSREEAILTNSHRRRINLLSRFQNTKK
jgi:hypothetical protein